MEKNYRDTIALNKPLPREEIWGKRWFIDGSRYWKANVIEKLIKLGVKVTREYASEMRMATQYKGIKLKSRDGGMTVEPTKQENYEELKKALMKGDYFFFSCRVPKTIK